MSANPKAYLVGGGVGSLAAAAFMIRDGKLLGGNISILEAAPVLGGSLDGSGDPAGGYSMRDGRMVTTDNYECTWDLYKSIPSLNHEGRTVFDETVEFNEKHKANSMARLVDRRRAKVPVASMGFSIEDRIELLKLSRAGEDALAASRITNWLSPAFISQFVEIADDVVFTVEYSVRAAQMAVYELLGIDRKIPPVTPHAESVHAQFEALLKAFK